MIKVRLSNSRVSTYYHCPRRYFLTYIEGLRPKGPSAVPLQVGGVTHDFKDLWISGKLPSPITADWAVARVNELHPGGTKEEARAIALQALSLFNAFLTKESMSPLKYESSETIMELECPAYVLYTRVDGLVRTPDERLWREETKTAARMDSGYLAGLKSSLQAGIAYKVMKELLPERVHGTIYTILVKTKVPQCERTMVGAEKSLLKLTDECLTGCIEGIKAERWAPSMNCFTYNRECDYHIICKGATPGIVDNFFERRADDGLIECEDEITKD